MTISRGLRFDILARDLYTCQICGKKAPETELEVDHIHPASKGGKDHPDNLMAACRDCNRGKADRFVDWRMRRWNTIIGKFFHGMDQEGFVDRQGQVIAELGGGFYLVDYFEWLTGSLSAGTHLVNVDRMHDERWRFYGTDEEMREAVETGHARMRPSDAERRELVKDQ